ncbi:hypothetical protein EJ04DRAFT_405342, partial [Polyplosphaeria fusca]
YLYSHLKKDEKEEYKDAMAFWEKSQTRFTTLKKVYENFSLQILSTVAIGHLPLIIGDSKPRRRLQILRDRFNPGEWDRQEQLRVKYDALKKRPKHANIESWLDSWISICTEGKEADMPIFLQDNPQRDFFQAVLPLDEAWGSYQLTMLIDQKNRHQSTTLIDTLVNSFRTMYRIKKPAASSLGTFS